MINELNILILFGISILLTVLLVNIRLKFNRVISNKVSEYNNLDYQQENNQTGDNLFREIFESSPECITLQNRDGNIEHINHTGLKLLETEEMKGVIGRSVYDLIEKDYCEAYREMSDRAFNGELVCLEYEMITFKGNRRWMKTKTMPLRNSQQVITGLVVSTCDITETRLLSQQLEDHRNKLQTII
ncbi:MAG: PAS domain S-box protein [Gammaproteobacteria bacterium]|nr:PAS domain S-box protein [Gammaproteobacteria bacterium]